MNIKINFHQMPHSDGLETHAREKLTKIATLFKKTEDQHPVSAELFLNAHTGAPSEVELRIRSGHISLASHDTAHDMYKAIDSVVDKMVTQIKKEKERLDDKHHKVVTDKTVFGS
jgi:putative sigma-54 modulation protein